MASNDSCNNETCTPLPVGGYDSEFVDAPPDSWECPVCLSTLRDPHLLSCCGVKICQSCITGIVNVKRPCPKCRKDNFTTLLEKELQRSILGLQVKCSLGCPWVGELRQQERHVSPSNEGDCPLVNVSCRNGCGHIMKRADEKKHEEETCMKRPIELQLVTIQCHMKRMFTEMKNTFETEMEEMKVMIATQTEEMEKLKEEIEKLKKEKEPQFTTTIPVFSSSILCLMPKLPSGNIPGVSYFPGDRFVKIAASCEQELEARTHLFLAEYEKILPRLSKEEFKVNEHFPVDSLKSFIDVCNKKFTACYVSYKPMPTPTIELVSNNTSQFEIAKKMISEKMKHKIYRMGFPGSTTHTLTLKCGNIKEEVIDVIVLFVGNSVAESPVVSAGSLTSFFHLSYYDSIVKPVLLPTVPPGKAILMREPKHCAKNVIYISSLSLQTTHGYFGKEAYSTVSESVKEAFKEAIGIEAKSIAFPCEATSGGGMQSNYIIPAVIEVVSQLINNKADDSVKDDSSLSDIRILIQDNSMDDAQLSAYFEYLALKYHLQ